MPRFLAFPPLVHMGVLALLYFALTAWTTAEFGANPPIRLANAVALVFVARQRISAWPWLLAVVVAANYAARQYTSTPGPLLVGLVNMFEVGLAAAVIQRGGRLTSPWYSPSKIRRLLVAWLLVPLISGAIGSLITNEDGLAGFLVGWRTWYIASALGMLIFVPLLLSWTDEKIRDRSLRTLPSHAVFGLAVGAGFCTYALLQEWLPPLMFLTFPVTLLLTWRYGLAGASTSLVTVGVVGSWATLQGVGAVVGMTPTGASLVLLIQALALYVASLVVCSLPFAALLVQQSSLLGRLKRTGDARSEFLAAMSHEIRTPLTGVLGMADLLAQEPLDARQQKFVDSMRGSGRHLLALVNDILDFSRIESGRLDLENIDFSLPETLERVRSLVHPTAADRGIALNMSIAPHSPPVMRGDPTRLSQVLLNLVGNAVKFTEAGSVTLTVTEGTKRADRTLYRFEVRDTGVGIPPEKLAQLFAPFTQADRTISRQYGGSGLGLAISKRLAEAMGGNIHVESEPGVGSVFTLEVPLEAGDETKLIRREEAFTAKVLPQRILIAEDVAVNREILATALGKLGHELTFAVNGVEAVRLAQEKEFDLVLMDVQMPQLDGVEATRLIRGISGPVANIPILGLTANVMASEQARYLTAGMNECLMKPIDWERLMEAIRRHGRRAADGEEVAQTAPAASAPTPAPAPVEEDDTLIDISRVDSLRAIADDDELAALLKQAVDAARDAAVRIGAAAELPDLVREAHKLKGSSGTVGLAKVSEVAGRIEESAREGVREVDAIARLPALVEASIAALERRKLLPAGA